MVKNKKNCYSILIGTLCYLCLSVSSIKNISESKDISLSGTGHVDEVTSRKDQETPFNDPDANPTQNLSGSDIIGSDIVLYGHIINDPKE